MSHHFPQPHGDAYLRIVALPRGANPSGVISGGRTLSHMKTHRLRDLPAPVRWRGEE